MNNEKKKKCKYDYSFEPLKDDDKIWEGVDCSKPFRIPNEKECNPYYDIKNIGLFDDEDKASLHCAFTKWNWDGDKKITTKKLSPTKLYKRRRRKSKMKKIMKKICNKSEELCPKDENISKHEYCEASKVCYDKMPSISGIYKDILLFAGIIINAFSSEGIENYFKKKKKNKVTMLNKEQLRDFQQVEALKQGAANIQQQGGNKYLSKKKKKKVKKNRIKKSRKK